MADLRKLTLLHSNDMHGDFLAEEVDGKLVGGVSMLSGYVQKVRAEEDNVLYAISGDMLRGSVIDSEYRGMSTIEIMNMIGPDVATLGNHEVDYGLSHLLFIEKCARFPIVNANMYLVNNRKRLFNSHAILEVGGMRVMFIGILTEDVLSMTRQDKVVGTLVDVYAAAAEVGKICDSYRTEDIDLTVLLTHIGFEEDKKLAEMLDPRWGVDVIVGGHSHTLLEEPAVVNGIPIVQAASGTDQIGRFDLVVNADTNSIESFTWQLIHIDESTCPRDVALEALVAKFKQATDEIYCRYVTRFERELTHPRRDRETELGRLFADVLRDSARLDIMMVGSGSLRNTEMGPLVEYQDLAEMYPYNDEIYRVVVTGATLKGMLNHVFREGAYEGEHTEMYQYSRGMDIVSSVPEKRMLDACFEGDSIADDRLFRIGLQAYHYKNMVEAFGLTPEVAESIEPSKVVITSTINVLDEYFSSQELVKRPADQRWKTIEG